MPSEILTKFGAIIRPTITLNSIATLNGNYSAAIDNSTLRMTSFRVFWQPCNGGVAPVAGTPYKLYMHSWHEDGTNNFCDDNLNATATTGLALEPASAECIMVIPAVATINQKHWRSAVVRDPAKKFTLTTWNGTGQTMHATPGNHDLIIVPLTWEAQ